MKEKFLIGELAQIYNISTDTLRHYDKIGLLQPEQDDNNRYRYYDISSMFKLSRILFLKNLDISLKEIQNYMSNKNTDRLLNMLNKKNDELDFKIQQLQNMKHKVNTKLELLELSKTKLDKIYITRLHERRGIFIKTIDLKDNSEIKQVFKQSGNYLKISSWLIEGQIYTSLSKSDMEEGIFNQFRYFIEINSYEDKEIEQITLLPEQDYACMTVIGPYEELVNHYAKLVKWIKDHGYLIDGDSIENNIVDSDYSESAEEFITELQIPIKKRQRF